MVAHDKYDNDILKQLTRIANSLEKIEKSLILSPNESRAKKGWGPTINHNSKVLPILPKEIAESSYDQVNQEIHNWPDWKKKAYNEDFQSAHSERLEIGKEIENR